VFKIYPKINGGILYIDAPNVATANADQIDWGSVKISSSGVRDGIPVADEFWCIRGLRNAGA